MAPLERAVVDPGEEGAQQKKAVEAPANVVDTGTGVDVEFLAHNNCNHSHKTIQHSSTGRWQAW